MLPAPMRAGHGHIPSTWGHKAAIVLAERQPVTREALAPSKSRFPSIFLLVCSPGASPATTGCTFMANGGSNTTGPPPRAPPGPLCQGISGSEPNRGGRSPPGELWEEENSLGRRLKLCSDTGSCSCGDLLEPHLALGPAQLAGGKSGFFTWGEKGAGNAPGGSLLPFSSEHSLQIQLGKHPCSKPAHPLLQQCPRLWCLLQDKGQVWHSFPAGRTWPMLSEVSNKSQTQLWKFSCKEQVFTVHIPAFFVPHRLPLPRLHGSWDGLPPLSLLRVFILGMLLPLADSSLLNSAHLVLKTESLSSGLATEGTELLCPNHPGLGVGSIFAHQEKAARGAGRGMSLLSLKGDFQLFCPHPGRAKGRFVAHGPTQMKLVRRIKRCKSLSCPFSGQDRRAVLVAGEFLLVFICWADSGPSPTALARMGGPQVRKDISSSSKHTEKPSNPAESKSC